MGIEYYVIDSGNKTFYDLGKGGWYELHYEMDVFSDLDILTLFILEDCYDEDYIKGQYGEDEWKETVDYITNRVAPDLFEVFGKSKTEDLVIVNDCGDDITICKAKRYKCLGTRYSDKDSKEYKEHMDYLNRHLEDSQINKRWWNPDGFTKYPEWEKY